ncbi:MAG TPA: class I SAM-dependent methyltransferase [Lacunisphaera sp.]|nr:class I SAM-dependent methyltransferase [Lacunisphaera sp.]
MTHDYAQHYARFHPDTPEHDANLRALLRRWLEPHLPADRGIVILDVGCGRGYALAFLRDLGYTALTGVDSDPGQVEFARSRNLPVTLVENTPELLRAHAARYDLILLMDVLEHIPVAQQTEFLSAVTGALRPGGKIIVTVPNASSPLGSYWRYVDLTHRIAFTIYSLHHALTLAGLAVDRIESVEFIARPRFLFWLPTPRAMRWWLLCLMRGRWRLTYLAELGWEQGWGTPLGPNLLAVAGRE